MATLVAGGLAGAGRFLLDILYKAYGMDLGPLNGLVQIPFLNYSCGVFAGCLILFWAVSKTDERPLASRIAGLTISWGERKELAASDRVLRWSSVAVAVCVLTLWIHFR